MTAQSLIIQSNIQSVFNDQRPLICKLKKIMKQLKSPLEFKAYWGFRMTSNVTSLETYKSIKTMHSIETWINLIYLDFYTLLTRVSYWKLVIHLSWDQALLSFSWGIRSPAGKANRKVSHLVQYLCTWIMCACKSNVMMIVASVACAFIWLPCYQMDLKLITMAFAVT